jgi:eukaryotic-like serine/threonine-protein kinase
VTGNLEKAYQTLELWLQTYPRGQQPNAQSLLGGPFERVIEVSQIEIAADPDFIFGYSNLASANYFLDRFEEAQQVVQRAIERNLGGDEVLMKAYNIALITGDREQMDRVVGLARGKPRAQFMIAHQEALALARSGRLEAARRSSNRAMDVARQAGERDETAASYQAARAVWEAVCGNAAEGKKNAMAALERSKGRDVQYAAGLALALSGDSSRSQQLADDLEKRFPEDRGIVGMDPIGALAHLQLGRAFAFSKDTTKAKAAYLDFLTLWKDADADVPMLRQAKAEYARLQ